MERNRLVEIRDLLVADQNEKPVSLEGVEGGLDLLLGVNRSNRSFTGDPVEASLRVGWLDETFRERNRDLLLVEIDLHPDAFGDDVAKLDLVDVKRERDLMNVLAARRPIADSDREVLIHATIPR
jgi:hypothetical protein